MNWCHTWFGIALGGLLFAIFWMGTLTVVDSEIDQWMKPELRMTFDDGGGSVILDDLVLPRLQGEAKIGSFVIITLPKKREPFLEYSFDNLEGERTSVKLNPRDGTYIAETESEAASDFFYSFHYMLHIRWNNIGLWLVGFSSMAMLVLIVSGIFIHRKIFADFFTFRPWKALRRSTLDLHNLTSVVALPFYFFITVSGLLILFMIFLPWPISAIYSGDDGAFRDDYFGFVSLSEENPQAAEMQSLDQYLIQAANIWTERTGSPEVADVLYINNFGTENATVTARQLFTSKRVEVGKETLVFDAISGHILKDFSAGPARHAHTWLVGLHYIQFDHWPLRWLYLVCGLMGCVMIATGNLFWMRARIRTGREQTVQVRVIRALTVGAVSGIIIATGAFLIANRLLPAEAALLGNGRAALEIWAFFLTWISTFIHAAVRDKAAWRDQCWVIAVLGVSAILLNWITTGDHIPAMISEGIWSVASMDLILLAGALTAIWAALRLKKSETTGAFSKHVQTEPSDEAQAR